VASTPPWTATLEVQHSLTLGTGSLGRVGQIRFSDGCRVTLESNLPGGNAPVQQAAFHQTDLRLAYTPDSDTWGLSLWAKNLENKAQTTQVLPFGRVQITDPRTVGLNLPYKR
jgi:hypothetical protein